MDFSIRNTLDITNSHLSESYSAKPLKLSKPINEKDLIENNNKTLTVAYEVEISEEAMFANLGGNKNLADVAKKSFLQTDFHDAPFGMSPVIKKDDAYIKNFLDLLTNSDGTLKSGGIESALQAYSDISNKIKSSGSGDVNVLQNSLKWAVGVAASNSVSDIVFAFMTLSQNGSSINQEYNEKGYQFSSNVVNSAYNLISKGMNYIDNNNPDLYDSKDISNMMEHINAGADGIGTNMSSSDIEQFNSLYRQYRYTSIKNSFFASIQNSNINSQTKELFNNIYEYRFK